MEEGRITNISNSYTYEYHLKDHLGNVRVAFSPNGSSANTLQVNEYYPFGSSFLPVSPENDNKFKFSDKEIQDDVLSGSLLNYYDFIGRTFDPIVPHFIQIDPLAEMSRRWSTYTYGKDNPMRFVDPDGMSDSSTTNNNNMQMHIYEAEQNAKINKYIQEAYDKEPEPSTNNQANNQGNNDQTDNSQEEKNKVVTLLLNGAATEAGVLGVGTEVVKKELQPIASIAAKDVSAVGNLSKGLTIAGGTLTAAVQHSSQNQKKYSRYWERSCKTRCL